MFRFVVCLTLAVGVLGAWTPPNCDDVPRDDDVAKDLDARIQNNKVFIVGYTYCRYCKIAKDYLDRMGFSLENDVEVLNLDEVSNGEAIRQYAYCQYTADKGHKSIPKVFIGQKFVGGGSETRMLYYTGEGVKMARDLGVITHGWFELLVKFAAIDYVDEGTERSAGGKYFILSKVICPHCLAAKNCLKQIGVDLNDSKMVELEEINDFLTHDEIKRYKGRLTGSPYTPYLAYNGKLVKNHAELQQVTGCTTPPYH